MTERTDRSSDDSPRRRGCCLGGCLLWTLTLLAAVQVAAVLILREDPGESDWRGALLVCGPQWPWIILPGIATVFALLSRRVGAVMVSLVALYLALFPIADLQIPGPPPAAEPERVVRILTWNLHAFPVRLDETRALIEAWDPDIVCLQEVHANEFAKILPGYYHRRGGDLRMFSRWPILKHRHIVLEPYPPKVALACDIETDAGPLTVMAVHFPRAIERGGLPRDSDALAEYVRGGMAARETKFAGLLEWLPDDRPLVVAGDMNTPPASKYYGRMAERMTDAFAARGSGFGYSYVYRDRWPLLRIDYVWCGGGVTPVSCEVGEAGPSDHRSVIADVALPPGT